MQNKQGSLPRMCSSKRQERTTPETIYVGGYHIHGVSVAAVETCVCIPALSLAFDSGKCPPRAISMRYMALTHGHCDHAHGLPLHLATRSLQKLPEPKYFVPADIVSDVRNFVDAAARLEQTPFKINIHPMSPSDPPFALEKAWKLKSFPTKHTVPSQGYAVLKTTKKLKAEYLGKSPRELVLIKKSGAEIENSFVTPEIVFTGDTTLDAIAESEDCRRARILITEMTFLDGSCSVENARKFGHIHLYEVKERKELFMDNEYVVFTHFSARYSKEAIRHALAQLPDELRKKSFALGVGQYDMDPQS